MTKKENEVLHFLSKYKSSSDEQLIYFTGCSKNDINHLVALNHITRDEKTKLLHLKCKKLDVRTVVALDVIKIIRKEIKECKYGKKYPVIFTTVTNDNKICDIIVVRKIEQEALFEKLKDYSNADKIIIVLESEKYTKTKINTTKEVLICTYPIKIIAKYN